MKNFAFTVCMFLALTMSVNMMAGPRTRQQAQQIAQSKAESLGIEATTSLQRVATQANVTEDVAAPYYVFNNSNNKGWTIVSGDDRMPEVLAYSDEGYLDMDNLPDAAKDIFAGFKKMYNSLDEAENTATTSASKAPRKATAYTTGLAVGPLLTTKWSQFEPYYNLTPTSSGTHCATCCVATAMAQIVYYLYCTQDGQTSTTFTNSITGTYASAAPRTYDWSSMLPGYLGTYTDAQATAVATLMRDCGYAINAAGGQITYGVGESTAYQSSVPKACSTYFGITGTTDSGTIKDASTFFSKIDTELNNYRPVQVVGNSHSFVCDGRAADGIYYHFNFGYAGGGDGFYCAGAYNGYDQYSDMEITYGFTLSNPTKTSTGLSIAYNSAVKTMGLRPVGTIPGMYQQSYYNTLKGYLDTAKGVIDGTTTMSDANQKTLINNIGTAEQDLVKYTTPFDSNGYNSSGYTASGTSYRIRSYKTYNGSYGYMGWYYDNDEGTYQDENPITSVYTSSTGSKWRFIYDSSSNGYYIGNNTLAQYLIEMPGYGQCPNWYVYGDANTTTYYNTKPDSNVNPCEVVATDYLGDGSFAVTIRPLDSGYTDDQDRYLTAWTSSSTLATASSAPSYVYGADPYGEYYSKWVLVPVYASSTTSTTPTASFTNSSVEINKGESATQVVTTNSSGTVTYSSSDITVATVDPTTGAVTGIGIGTATITAAISGTTTYNVSGYAAAVATYTVTIKSSSQVKPTASFEKSDVTLVSGATTTNKLNTNSDGAVTYSSSDISIVSVAASDEGAVITAGATTGTVTITANIAATENYSAATATFTVTVTEDSKTRTELEELIADAKTLYTDAEYADAQTAVTQKGQPIVEATTSITSGNQYVIGYTSSGTTYYMTSNLTDGIAASVTAPTTDCIFTLTGTTSSGTTTYTIGNSDGYLKYSSAQTPLTFAESGTNFTCTFSGSTCKFSFVSARTRYLSSNASNNFTVSASTTYANLTLYKITGYYSPTEGQQSIYDLNAAITTAEAVTTATQSDIETLQTAINNYYKALTNLELVDSKAYCSTLEKQYDKATYSRTVGSNKWGTICLPYDIATDANVQLYQATAASATTLTVEKVATVAAGTPAIFKNLSDATTVTFEKANATAISCAEGKVTSTTPTMKATYRNLSNQTGMYFIANDAFWKANDAITINTFRGWLDASASNAKSLTIVVDGEATDISNISNDTNTSNDVYNIAGQRVVTPQKGQIIIINGKKTIAK